MFDRIREATGLQPEKAAALLSLVPAADSGRLRATAPRVRRPLTVGPLLPMAYTAYLQYRHFPYDWRDDLVTSARHLLDLLGEGKGEARRWRIMAHGQGALVVVVASKLAAEDRDGDAAAFSSIVSRVVLLAPPLAGTLRAVNLLANGEDVGPHAQLVATFASSWPAVYQMLPTWPSALRRSQSAGKETSQDAAGFFDPGCWKGTAVRPALLDRARRTHRRYLVGPLSCMSGVDCRIVLSRSHVTGSHVGVSDKGLGIPARDEPGDGVVPADSTVAVLDPAERFVCQMMGKGKQTLPHAYLADDPVAAAFVHEFLEDDPANPASHRTGRKSRASRPPS
jgi:hypothetical protein